MRRLIFSILFMAAVAQCASQREIAEWVIRWEGQVTIANGRGVLADVDQIPAGDIQITSIDLTAGVMHPIELIKLQGLPNLRQLYLPGPVWNPGGSNEDRKGVFQAFSTLTGVQRLAFGWHYNAQIEIGDNASWRT
jgi:hypothetical protein